MACPFYRTLHLSINLSHFIRIHSSQARLSPLTCLGSLIGVLHSTTIQKMSTPPPSPLARNMVSTGSLVRKSPIQELLTSRGSSHFEDAVISSMFGISTALGSISRQLEVLLNKTETIALKLETLQKEVTYLKKAVPVPGMMSPPPSPLPSQMEIEAWLNSPLPIPEPGISVDLTCSETLNFSSNRNTGQIYQSNGYMGNQAQANQEQHMMNFQKHT